MKAEHRGSAQRCAGVGTLPKGFLQPCLLLMLQEQPGYGYDLVTRLKALGIDDDSASVYRALRTLEENHAVSSYWYTSSTGPARHMYRITPAGRDRLQATVTAAAETHLAIERYLCRYALTQSPPPDPDDRVLAAGVPGTAGAE
jgi:PadR family transcriptional regulator, regulatory protein PadR